LPVATTVAEILPGVFRWAAFSPHHKVELAAHAVAVDGALVVFDPIPLVDAAMSRLLCGPEARTFESVAPNVQPSPPASETLAGGPECPPPRPCRIILTNENHERDAARWRQILKAPVWSAADPSGGLPQGWEALPLPGGAPGETACFHAPLSLMVFGDAVVNLPERGLELLPAKYCTDPAELRRSLGRLPRFERALFAHGQPLLAAASGRIAALL